MFFNFNPYNRWKPIETPDEVPFDFLFKLGSYAQTIEEEALDKLNKLKLESSGLKTAPLQQDVDAIKVYQDDINNFARDMANKNLLDWNTQQEINRKIYEYASDSKLNSIKDRYKQNTALEEQYSKLVGEGKTAPLNRYLFDEAIKAENDRYNLTKQYVDSPNISWSLTPYSNISDDYRKAMKEATPDELSELVNLGDYVAISQNKYISKDRAARIWLETVTNNPISLAQEQVAHKQEGSLDSFNDYLVKKAYSSAEGYTYAQTKIDNLQQSVSSKNSFELNKMLQEYKYKERLQDKAHLNDLALEALKNSFKEKKQGEEKPPPSVAVMDGAAVPFSTRTEFDFFKRATINHVSIRKKWDDRSIALSKYTGGASNVTNDVFMDVITQLSKGTINETTVNEALKRNGVTLAPDKINELTKYLAQNMSTIVDEVHNFQNSSMLTPSYSNLTIEEIESAMKTYKGGYFSLDNTLPARGSNGWNTLFENTMDAMYSSNSAERTFRGGGFGVAASKIAQYNRSVAKTEAATKIISVAEDTPLKSHLATVAHAAASSPNTYKIADGSGYLKITADKNPVVNLYFNSGANKVGYAISYNSNNGTVASYVDIPVDNVPIVRDSLGDLIKKGNKEASVIKSYLSLSIKDDFKWLKDNGLNSFDGTKQKVIYTTPLGTSVSEDITLIEKRDNISIYRKDKDKFIIINNADNTALSDDGDRYIFDESALKALVAYNIAQNNF